MKALILTAALALTLTACAQKQCVQPDPIEPAHNECWNKGLDCGTGIVNPGNKK